MWMVRCQSHQPHVSEVRLEKSSFMKNFSASAEPHTKSKDDDGNEN